ncbi:MAG: hypothetical protein ABIL70_03420 [candidate division WOR-3 bacterium]
MGRIIFFAILVAGLCFGQVRDIDVVKNRIEVKRFIKNSFGIAIGRKQYFGAVDPFQPKEVFTIYGVWGNRNIYKGWGINFCYNYWPAYYLCPEISHFNEQLFYREHTLALDMDYKHRFEVEGFYLMSGVGIVFNYLTQQISDELGCRIYHHWGFSTLLSIRLDWCFKDYGFPVSLGCYWGYIPGIFGIIDVLDGAKSTLHSLNVGLTLGYTF